MHLYIYRGMMAFFQAKLLTWSSAGTLGLPSQGDESTLPSELGASPELNQQTLQCTSPSNDPNITVHFTQQ